MALLLAAPAGAQAPAVQSRLTALLRGDWDSNARFLPGQGGAWSSNLGLVLEHDRRLPRGTLSLSGNGGATYYPGVDGLSRVDFGGRVSGSLDPNPGTHLSASQSVTRAYAPELADLTGAGLVLPRTSVLSGFSLLSLEQRLGRSTRLVTTGNFQWLRFDEIALQNGSELGGRALVLRSVGRFSSLGLGAGARRSTTMGQSQASESLLASYVRTPGRGPKLQVEAGVAFLDGSPRRPVVGTASLSQNGRRATLELKATRNVSQAFGLGRERIADLGDLTATFSLTRRLGASASAVYGVSRETEDTNRELQRSASLAAGLNFKLSRSWLAALGYVHQRSEQRAESTTGHRLRFQLSYVKELR